MANLREEISEFENFTKKGISVGITRGVVISVHDPLYSGRVKVWIPTIHGGKLPVANDPSSSKPSNTLLNTEKGVASFLVDNDSVDCLPWASTTGHNWGPTGDPQTGTPQVKFGVFNVPKVGTEVYVDFEDGNPNMPIILGAVFHIKELVGNVPLRAIEITPGTPAFRTPNTIVEEVAEYDARVSSTYIISSYSGSGLLISDISQQEQIRLGGNISLLTRPITMDGSGTVYANFSDDYPNFPSTASAPFVKRNSPAKGTPKIDTTKVAGTVLAAGGNTATITADKIVAATKEAAAGAPPVPTKESDPSKIIKCVPVTASFPTPTMALGQAFGATRAKGRTHMGVDLVCSLYTPVIAPIDCVPVGYWMTSNAGLILTVVGKDGYMHAFVHVATVDAQIKKKIDSGDRTEIKCGTQIATVGGRAGINTDVVSQVKSAGNGHLHWEVIPCSGVTFRNTDQARAYRYNIWSKNGCIDPFKDWLKNKDVNTTVQVSPSQVAAVTAATTSNIPVATAAASLSTGEAAVAKSNLSSDQDKPIGLEICMVAGAESIFLRHPSGSFIGIDPDGNIKIFSVGDVQIKSNRSIVFDVLGGVITNALAVYTKAQTVIRSAAATIASYNTSTPKGFPSIFNRLDTFRKLDMADAVASSSDNIYYTLENGGPPKAVSDILKDGYAIIIDAADVAAWSKKNYGINTYDKFIADAHAKYIAGSTNSNIVAFAGVLTTKLIKSIMIVESNGDPNAVTKDNIGLFQLNRETFNTYSKKDAINITTAADMSGLLDPEKNVIAAVQHIAYLLYQVLLHTKKAYDAIPKPFNYSDLTDVQKEDIVKVMLLYYHAGVSPVSGSYKSAVSVAQIPSYPETERVFATSDLYKGDTGSGVVTLKYVPQVLYVYKKSSMSFSPADTNKEQQAQKLPPAKVAMSLQEPPAAAVDKNYLLGKFNPSSHSKFVKVPFPYTDKPGMLLRTEAFTAFEAMYKQAKKDGIDLKIISSTRNFDQQKGIWENKWSSFARNQPIPKNRALAILEYSSMPGSSRHHWGTDIDLNDLNNSSFESGGKYQKVYQWLSAHASGFGFNQPYTAGRSSGYKEEKWHWSYTPLSKPLLAQYNTDISNSDIQPFSGSDLASEIGVIQYYVSGVSQDCV